MAASGGALRFAMAPRPAGSAALCHFPMCYGPEFVAKALREWIAEVGAKTAYIEPGSPWGETVKQSVQWTDCRSNGYCESFNGKLRDELLNGEIFCKRCRNTLHSRLDADAGA